MLHRFLLLLVLLLIGLTACANSTTVDRVVDGDTFVLDSGEKVRLIGVDAPESQHPGKPVEYYSAEAKAFLTVLVLDREIRLEYGDPRTDKYGRLLCYVWLKDSVLVNKEMIAGGYALAFLRFTHEREEEFLEAELYARRAAIGMWASASAPRPQPPKPKPEVKKQTTTETVYITKTGSKYHQGNCGYLRKSKIPISKEDAQARGYGACSKCRP